MEKEWKKILTFVVVLALIAVGLSLFFPSDKPNITSNVILEEESNNNIEDPEVKIKDDINSNYLHFYHKVITFSMEGEEAPLKRQRMHSALNELQQEVGEFVFEEIDNYEEADIKINFPKPTNLPTVGEARPIFDEEGDIIGGEITIIKIKDDCGYHGTELHELLHVFGFDHKRKEVMYEYSGSCLTLTYHSYDYVEHLRFIYSNGKRGIEHPELPMYGLKQDYVSSCINEGWYPIEGTKYCCPEPEMIIDEEGYCSY
jgi:hypothetical protein